MLTIAGEIKEIRARETFIGEPYPLALSRGTR